MLGGDKNIRIGIVTLPMGENYGGILQNYALQQVLIKMGYEPYTIVIRDRLWAIRWIVDDCRALLSLFGDKNSVFINPVKFYKKRLCRNGVKNFIKNNIKTTRAYDYNPIAALREYKFRILIAGSDQVWRPMYYSHIEDRYLGFAQNTKVRKIAYAASFGVDTWEYTLEQENICRVLAKLFDAISVRELSGIELCQNHLGVKADWVVDPTLLLNKTDYEQICLSRQVDEPYVFVYLLDYNPELMNRVKSEADRRNCRIVFKSADSTIKKTDSIEVWLSLIANAEFVFTDSFHGTLFSLLFEKQFITFVNSFRGGARFATIKSILPISDRIIGHEEPFPSKSVDYLIINEIIECERRNSLLWLKKALSEIR